jgi:hypothetical protein
VIGRTNADAIPRAFLALCVVVFVGLVVLGFGTTFRSDEWEFITNRSLFDPVSLLRPFNGHWLTVPMVIYLALFQVFELRSYVPYLVVLVLLHVSMSVIFYRLLARLSLPAIALAGAVLVLVSAYGHENLFWAFQIGMVGATVFGLAAFYELAGPSPVGWRIALLLTLAIASHAVGFAFLAGSWVLAMAARRWRLAAWVLVPGAILAVWAVTLQISQLSTQTPIAWPGLPSIVGFIAEGSAASAGAMVGLRPEVGIIVLLAGGLVIAWFGRPANSPMVVGAATVIAAEFAMVSFIRGFLGPGEAAAPRYLYVSVPLLLTIVAAWVGKRSLSPIARPRLQFTVAALVVTVAVLGNARLLILGRGAANTWSDRTRAVSYLADRVPWLPQASVFQMPPPVELRQLQDRFGRLDRDSMIGVAFAAPPQEAIVWVCEQFFADPDRARECATAGASEMKLAAMRSVLRAGAE